MSLVYFCKLVEILEESPELKRTFVGIAKQVGYAAAGGVAGGVLGGPIGCFIGLIAGSWFGLGVSDDYQSMISVLKSMPEHEKLRLQHKIQELIGSGTIESLMCYVQNEVNRTLLLQTINEELKPISRGG